MTASIPDWTISRLAIGVALAIGLALRSWGSFFDLPYVFDPDEATNIRVAHAMFTAKDLNPHFFQYPSLFFYLNAAAYFVYALASHVLGGLHQIGEIAAPITIVMGTSFAPAPAVVVVGRLISIAFGTATIAVVYATGRCIGYERRQAAAAAALTAVSPALVAHSRWIHPDAQAVFFVALSLWMSLLVLQRGRTRDYVLAAIAIGCAGGTKYNAALAAVSLITAHLLRHGWRGVFDQRLWLAAATTVVTFLVSSPYALLNYPSFVEGIRYEMSHYATGHPGMEGDSARWYGAFLWASEGLACLMALVQIVRGVVHRSTTSLVLAAFPIAYLLVVSSYVVRNEQTVMLILPFIHLLAVGPLFDFTRRMEEHAWPLLRAMALPSAALGVILLVAGPLRMTAEEARRVTTVDSRTTARVWIADHIPAGSHIALESYAPFLDANRYQLSPVMKMIDRSPDWFESRQVDYLLFSGGMFRRYIRNPARYGKEKAAYDELFRRFPLVRAFSDGDYEVRLHRPETGNPP